MGLELQSTAYQRILDQVDAFYGEQVAAVNFNADLPPELAALVNDKINLALADFDCRASTSFTERRNAWLLDAENQFVADKQEAVTALRNALELNS